jgi:hypothetical protein
MERLIRELYASFNARDIEAVIPALHEDVDWPNAWEGGRLKGHDAVRAYWRRQFAEIVGTVEPTEIVTAGNEVIVTVHQTVRDHDGNVLSDGTVTHTYTIREGRIARMDVS